MRCLSLLALLAVMSARGADDVPLFNGKDFTGWQFFVKDNKEAKKADAGETWSVVDGYIRCTGKPNGYILTEKAYGDYTLKLKWRFPADGKGGNSGVLLHCQDEKYWPTSVEAQLQSGRAGDLWLIMPPATKLEVDAKRQDPKQARHYFRYAIDTPVEKKFGEWNEYEITCKGGDITLAVNGAKVNEGKNGNHTKGKIALQSEGAEVHFKDVVLKPLK